MKSIWCIMYAFRVDSKRRSKKYDNNIISVQDTTLPLLRMPTHMGIVTSPLCTVISSFVLIISNYCMP